MATPLITSAKGVSDAERAEIAQLWPFVEHGDGPSPIAVPGYHRLNSHGQAHR